MELLFFSSLTRKIVGVYSTPCKVRKPLNLFTNTALLPVSLPIKVVLSFKYLLVEVILDFNLKWSEQNTSIRYEK